MPSSPTSHLQKLKFQFLKGCTYISSQYMTSKAILYCRNFRSQIWTWRIGRILNSCLTPLSHFFRYTNEERARLCKNKWSCVSINILKSIVKPTFAKLKCFLDNKRERSNSKITYNSSCIYFCAGEWWCCVLMLSTVFKSPKKYFVRQFCWTSEMPRCGVPRQACDELQGAELIIRSHPI